MKTNDQPVVWSIFFPGNYGVFEALEYITHRNLVPEIGFPIFHELDDGFIVEVKVTPNLGISTSFPP